jgi:hypothetical protein
VMDKVNVNVVNVVNVMKDTVGVLAVLAMHSGNMNKNIELRCAREMKDNVGMLAVLAMHSGNVNNNIERMCAREVMRNMNVNNVVLAVLAKHFGNVYKNIKQMCACEMMRNMNVNNTVLAVLAMFDVEHVGEEINRYVKYVHGYVNNVDVKKEVLAVLAMIDVIRKGDITPRLNRTPREESEDRKGVKKEKLDKETDDTFEEGMMNVEDSTKKRDVVVNINPEGKHDEDVKVGNMKKRDVVVNIIDAVILNAEYEAGVKVSARQGAQHVREA